MRTNLIVRTTLGVFLATSCCRSLSAEESGSRWWPFGGSEETVASDPSPASYSYSVEPPTTVEPERSWMFSSPFANISWPEFHMPEIVLPRPKLPRPQFWPRDTDVAEARNAWVQESPDPDRPSPWQAVKGGAMRVRESTRSAWRKTVDVLAPGEDATPRVAQREPRLPLWGRMFGGEETTSQGPRTVSEWMAQDRLDP